MTDVSACDYIEPIRLADNLIFFYWGRHPQHDNLDMQLGGGACVIFSGTEAIVFDSMNLPGQGSWVRHYMESHHGIRKFILVNSHCHEDHIAENHVYADCTLVAHEDTRRLMQQHRERLQQGSPGVPGFPVVLADITFRGRLDLWCGTTKVELHEFRIHEQGHIAVYLPQQKILLAADMLEDPLWIFHFDFAEAAVQIAEFERMAAMDIEHIYPAHGDVETIRRGGYRKDFIQQTVTYLQRMMAAKDDPDFMQRDAQSFIADFLQAGDLHWWEPYAQVHAANCKTLQEMR